MAVPQNFRTAMRGFHREDVVHYLEYLNAKHQAELNQLAAENESLRSALEAQQMDDSAGQSDALRGELEIAQAANETIQAEQAALQAELDALRADFEFLQEEYQTLRAQLEEAESGRQAAQAQVLELEEKFQELETREEKPAPVFQPELDTYRRAENVEKESRYRAELVYYQANGVLSDTSAKVEKIAEELTAVADETMQELTRLQMAVSESKHVLRDAAAMMKAIRPNT